MRSGYILLIGCMVLCACKKDFLNLKPHTSADISSFYKTQNDIRVAREWSVCIPATRRAIPHCKLAGGGSKIRQFL